jgi:hypothetical protein
MTNGSYRNTKKEEYSMAWKGYSCKIAGDTALLLHNGELANPLSKFAMAIKAITSKRKKTEKDIMEIARLEFHGGLHLADGKPCVTPEMIEATITGAFKLSKRGKDAARGITCEVPMILTYDGPKDIDKLWEDERFVFTTQARVGQAKVMRTRPRFLPWGGTLAFKYEDSVFNKDAIVEAVEQAGAMIGFGDWRPKYGRFHVVEK